MSSRSQTVLLAGGLDIESPGITKKPGFVIASKNYEGSVKGYRRKDGYERFDGSPEPHESWPHQTLAFTAGQNEPSVNDIITGGTSGATGVLVELAVVSSGDWATNDAVGTLHLRNVSGTFQSGEALTVGATATATTSAANTYPVYESTDTEELYRQLGIMQATGQISAVTGSGDILGGFTYNGDQYVFRNNAGGTAAAMFKSTSAGWVEQTFGHTIDFTAGTAEFTEQETVTGGTSGATATIERVVKQSGAWSTSDAAGYLVLSGVSGTFSASETITSAGGSATNTAAQAAISLPAGGKYRSDKHNFYGTSNLRRAYFTNEVGYAHEWDGTVLAPIKVPGLTSATDKPTHIGILSNHLFLAYPGGSMMFSAPGLPLVHDATLFAGEVGLGEDITGVEEETDTALIVTGRNAVAYLTGYDINDFTLQRVGRSSGAKVDTLQVLDQPYFVDDIGIRGMSSVAKFGDWQIGTLSLLIESFFRTKKAAGATIVGSMRVRSKSFYRLFWDDKSYLSIYFGRGKFEPMRCELDVTPTCFWSGEDANGDEALFFGATDGVVYRMDVGQSHDDATMEYFMRMAYMHQGSPDQMKRYTFLVVEFDASGPANELGILTDYTYGEDDGIGSINSTFDIYGTGGHWDEDNWNEFYWSAPVEGKISVEVNGYGENISVVFAGSARFEDPHTIESVTVQYLPRKVNRGKR